MFGRVMGGRNAYRRRGVYRRRLVELRLAALSMRMPKNTVDALANESPSSPRVTFLLSERTKAHKGLYRKKQNAG